MSEAYTRDQIWNAAWAAANKLSYDDLAGLYAEDLYEFYRQAADDQEIDEFMKEHLED